MDGGRGEFCLRFSGGFEGKGVGVGRAYLKPGNMPIPAGFFRFTPDERDMEPTALDRRMCS